MPELVEELHKIRASNFERLTLLIIGGACDPVSEGKRLVDLDHALRKAGTQHLQLNLYPQARHELFNETNRDRVTALRGLAAPGGCVYLPPF